MISEKELNPPILFSLQYILPLIILIEGYISIAIEILTIRQLLPVAGGSVIVTSLIIGIFLLFLALGYQHGGNTRNNPTQLLQRNFFIASLWFGIGLSYIFIDFFFYFIQMFLGPRVLYPLIIYLLLIIAPLIFILGQTLPITMNMVKQNSTVGKIGGNTLSLSTLGSFLGAVTTSLFFMSYFGVGWTIVINVVFLLLLSLLLTPSHQSFLLKFCLAVIIIPLIFIFNVKSEKTFFVLTNNYANYQIKTNQAAEKTLIINNGYSSYLSKDKKGFQYAELIKKVLFKDMQLVNKEILVLGAGGFSLSAENTYGNNFTYVDVDPMIKKVVVPHFLKSMNSTLIIDDARHFIQSTLHHYDVIISDAYSDIKSIPAHLITKEYMLAIQSKLTRNGIAIFNIIANPMLTDPYSRHIDNTIRAVFLNCMSIPQIYADKVTNIIYLCPHINIGDNQIYSDHVNNSTTEAFTW